MSMLYNAVSKIINTIITTSNLKVSINPPCKKENKINNTNQFRLSLLNA